MSKKSLDYLLIAGGGDKTEREKRAKEEIKKRKIRKVLVLKGKDSEEEILNIGKILKKGNRVGIDTFPLHYKEYKVIIKKAKKEGKFPKGIKIENVRTGQNLGQTIYGFLGLEEEKIMHKKVKYVKNRDNKLFRRIKGFVKNLF
ncbi:MAG TPA: hypothetical protein ENH99_03070 [Candidatus Pacearchaeota archaeon]|nr:hypothetical protein [Candidatus Pacearchaeota archaeon]